MDKRQIAKELLKISKLVESDGSLEKELKDAIFNIDQAIGHLNIISSYLGNDPEFKNSVFDKQIKILDKSAKVLERTKGSVG